MKIAVTSGDINGIGLECFFKSIPHLKNEFGEFPELLLYCDIDIIVEYSKSLNCNLELHKDYIISEGVKITLRSLNVHSKIEFGELTESSGKYSAESIKTALIDFDKEKYKALVTLPINKEAIKLSGWKFPGHTEMLADHFGKDVLMVLFDNDIRVALVTVHEPISAVSGLISEKLIIEKAGIFKKSLQNDFAIDNPKIAVLGLNPHAGENGKIGSEEVNFINETIEKLNNKNIDAIFEGPYPADGFFGFGTYKKYDGILAMYHDQGLVPLKLLANGAGVNFTTNLPIVRTSPDHGTAFDIAGKNKANELSTAKALISACNIAINRERE